MLILGAKTSGLSLPAGLRPRFNPRHPAAVGIAPAHGFSGISRSNTFINLLNGAVGTVVSTPTASIFGRIGPCTYYPTATTASSTFSGQSTAADSQGTVAAIFQPATVVASTTCLFYTSGGATSGMGIGMSSTSKLIFLCLGGTNATSTIGIAAGVPYFFAASNQPSGSCYFVLTRLDNGSISQDTQPRAGPTATATTGVYAVGNTPSSSRVPDARIAAAMFSPKAISFAALQQWATNPWSFWYHV